MKLAEFAPGAAVAVQRSVFMVLEEESGSDVIPVLVEQLRSRPVAVVPGGLMIASGCREHTATVSLNVIGGDTEIDASGWDLLLSGPFQIRTGRLEVWTLFSGPAEVDLTLDRPGTAWTVAVYGQGRENSQARCDERADTSVSATGLESYHCLFRPGRPAAG